MKIKNRTLFAIIGAIVAIVILLVLIPLVTNASVKTVDVLRLRADVPRGTQLTQAHLETVSVPVQALPSGCLKNSADVIGKYAAAQLYAGDYLSSAKLNGVSNSADDVLETLDGRLAISVPAASFAGILSGKLENGDIVRFYITVDGKTFVPGALQWVKVITTTTGTGIDRDQIVENEDGSYDMPSTVTVLVSNAQAELLAHYASGASMHLALVSRGDEQRAQQLLAEQEAYLENQPQEPLPSDETEAD